MSYIDDRNAFLDKLVIEFEKEFNQFGRKFKRMLAEFISQGFHTHDDAIRFFAGTGFTDTVLNVVGKYEEALKVTQDLSKELGLRFVLPETGYAILELMQQNKVAEILGSSENIIRTVTDAAFRYGQGGESLNNIIADLTLAVDDFTRRVTTEAFTGASMFERSSKLQLYQANDIDLYFYSGPVDSKNREVCANTLGDSRQYKGWTLDEIATSETPFIACGGYNCRHEWLAFVPGARDLVDEMRADAGLGRKTNI